MANLQRRNPGGLPSKPDYRANIVAAAMAGTAAPTLPAELSTDFKRLGGALDQKQTPACVSHAQAQLMKLWWFLKTGQVLDFSPRFLHIVSGMPAYGGPIGVKPEDGRDPMSVARIAQRYGCPTTDVFPNDTSLSEADYFDPRALTQAVFDNAAQHKIPGYVPVTCTQAGIREAIQKYGAVSMLFRISSAFWTDKSGNVTWDQAAIDPVRPPASVNAVVGGHELVGMQWNNTLDHFLNSWSDQWAQQGESDYIWNEWAPYIVEALAIAEVPSSALALVQGLPKPGEFKHSFAAKIGYGDSGDEVRALQIALSIDGENVYPEITGYYGNATRQAVLGFQLKYQVAPPAVLLGLNGRTVGPATQAKLNQLFNK